MTSGSRRHDSEDVVIPASRDSGGPESLRAPGNEGSDGTRACPAGAAGSTGTAPAGAPGILALLAHDGFVRRLSRSVLADRHLAEDVAQEAWLAALRRPPDEEPAALAWLGSVVRNAAAMLTRSLARARGRDEAAARPEAVQSAADSAGDASVRAAVVAAVLDLGEPCRTALLLRFWHDLPPRDIAAALGVPVETVRTRIKRGLDRLRVRLADRSF